MRRLAAIGLVAPSVASAAPMSVEGQVTNAQSHWTADGSRIVTEATVHTIDGDVVVSQLGGTVDGLTMRTMPGPEILEPGMTVAVAAHEDLDLAQRLHVVVDDVEVKSTITPYFVRTGPTKAGHYLFWESGCIFVHYGSEGTKDLPIDTVSSDVDQGIATWNDDTMSCSYMVMKNSGPLDNHEVGRDNINIIKFRDVSWCRPAIGDDPARCYAHSAAGITTAVYVDDGTSKRDGAIVDADVEINGVDFSISDKGMTNGTQPCNAELLNTLTHELGHVHGLEHPCLAPGDPPRIDDQGNAVPACSATTDSKITEATMYNFQDCGETKKETLSDDDINAICVVYPTANDPHTCSPVGSSSGICNVSGDHPERPLASLLLVAIAVGLSRRKKSRRHP
jgi:hypothetical protein